MNKAEQLREKADEARLIVKLENKQNQEEAAIRFRKKIDEAVEIALSRAEKEAADGCSYCIAISEVQHNVNGGYCNPENTCCTVTFNDLSTADKAICHRLEKEGFKLSLKHDLNKDYDEPGMYCGFWYVTMDW
jgi:hypothetical protein